MVLFIKLGATWRSYYKTSHQALSELILPLKVSAFVKPDNKLCDDPDIELNTIKKQIAITLFFIL